MQAISNHVGSYQGIAYCGLTKWTNEDLFLSFAYNFKNVTYVYNTRLLQWGGGAGWGWGGVVVVVVLPVIKLFSNIVFFNHPESFMDYQNMFCICFGLSMVHI